MLSGKEKEDVEGTEALHHILASSLVSYLVE